MLFAFCILANDSVDNSFENIFLGQDAVHIFDEIESLFNFVVLEVVDN